MIGSLVVMAEGEDAKRDGLFDPLLSLVFYPIFITF
jgi:hypothetical protein